MVKVGNGGGFVDGVVSQRRKRIGWYSCYQVMFWRLVTVKMAEIWERGEVFVGSANGRLREVFLSIRLYENCIDME